MCAYSYFSVLSGTPGGHLPVAQKQEGHRYLTRWSHLRFGQAERLTSSRGDGGDPRADTRHQTLWEDLVSGVSARFITTPGSSTTAFQQRVLIHHLVLPGEEAPVAEVSAGGPGAPFAGLPEGDTCLFVSSAAAQRLAQRWLQPQHHVCSAERGARSSARYLQRLLKAPEWRKKPKGRERERNSPGCLKEMGETKGKEIPKGVAENYYEYLWIPCE